MSQFRLSPETSVYASPTKASFGDNEEPVIVVNCTVERLGWAGPWVTRFIVYQGSTVVADQSSRHVATNMGEGIDLQPDNYQVGLGRNLTPGTYTFTVVVSAHDGG